MARSGLILLGSGHFGLDIGYFLQNRHSTKLIVKNQKVEKCVLLKITSYKNTVMPIARIFGESTSVGFFVESNFIMN